MAGLREKVETEVNWIRHPRKINGERERSYFEEK